jgi:hypothetical protein
MKIANTLDSNTIDLGGYDSTYDTTMSTSGIDTITLNSSATTSITSPMYSSTIIGGGGGTSAAGTYTISTGGAGITSPYLYSNNTWATSNTSGITVKGDADFDGDVKVKGKSLTTWMETMEKRLAILVPDPKKLEKFEALQKAYNHYKMLEALCDIQDDPTE